MAGNRNQVLEKISYDRYFQMLNAGNDRQTIASQISLSLFVQYVEALGANFFLGAAISEVVEIPEAIALTLGAAGVALAMNIGHRVNFYVHGTMEGLYPATLAKCLSIKIDEAEALLRGEYEFQGTVAKRVSSCVDEEVTAPTTVGGVYAIEKACMANSLGCTEDEAERLVTVGVHSPVFNLAMAVPVSAGIGLAFYYAGFAERSNDFGFYATAGTVAFGVTKLMANTSGLLSNTASGLWQRCRGEISFLRTPLLDA